MVKRSEQSRFLVKTRQSIRVVGELVLQNFERYIAAKLDIAGLIHLAHTTRTNWPNDFVVLQPGAWCESQVASDFWLESVGNVYTNQLGVNKTGSRRQSNSTAAGNRGG